MIGDDEDVFDSVTWESPAAPAFDIEDIPHTGPGFRQSTAESEGPHDPKWEGYLITTVKDPVKELAETKDAYVSYLVQAKVRSFVLRVDVILIRCPRQIYLYSRLVAHHLADAFKTLFS